MMNALLVGPGGDKAVVDDANGRESVRYHWVALLAPQTLSDS